MAQHKSAEKRNKQSQKKRLQNKAFMSRLKTAVKKVRTSQTKDEGEKLLKKAVTLLDQYATKGIIHKNNAANKKRKLTLYVNSLKEK